MQSVRKRNAFLVAALAMFFWWAFQLAKHNPLLRTIVPFSDDPYDAVSSFGAITAVLLALVSLGRSCFPQYLGHRRHTVHDLRVQAAIPFCLLVAVSAEAVAMARHYRKWAGAKGSVLLLMLEFSVAALAGIVLFLTKGKSFGRQQLLVRAAVIWSSTLLVLAVYPEQLIRSTPGHLVTVMLGSVLLFAPVAALVEAWLPGIPQDVTVKVLPSENAPQYSAFFLAAALGLIVGACAYGAEVSEDSVRPALTQVLFVGGVFISLGASAMAIGYALLGRLLGFAVVDHG